MMLKMKVNQVQINQKMHNKKYLHHLKKIRTKISKSIKTNNQIKIFKKIRSTKKIQVNRKIKMVINDKIKSGIKKCKFKQNNGIFIINKTTLILIYQIWIHKMHQKISPNLKVIWNKRNLKKTRMVQIIKISKYSNKRILKRSIS